MVYLQEHFVRYKLQLLSPLLHVSVLLLLYQVCCKIDKRRTHLTVPDACARLSFSARGLGGTYALACFMMCEEDLIYDPTHL